MSRESFLLVLAALVILAPFAGLPIAWLVWVLPILGVLIFIIGVSLRRRRLASRSEAAPEQDS